LVDKEIISTRLSKLRESLRQLKDIAARPRDEYLGSSTDKALAEHFLRLSLESMLDIGNHIVSDEGFRKPLQLREIPLILAENRVIERELADKLARSVGLRNRLVHAYTDIDHEIIYGLLKDDLDDLEDYVQAVVKLCDQG